MLRRRPGEMRLPGGSQGGWCQAAKRKQEAQRQGAAGEAQLRRAGADGDVGVQHHDGGVPPGEAVPALVAERVERLELGLPAVRLDVVVAERREPGRLAHDRRVRAEDVAIEQLRRAQRVGVVAHREHEVRVPGLDHRGDRRLVAVAAAEVAHDREGEPGGADRRGPERALGEHAGVRPRRCRCSASPASGGSAWRRGRRRCRRRCGRRSAGSRRSAPGPPCGTR